MIQNKGDKNFKSKFLSDSDLIKEQLDTDPEVVLSRVASELTTQLDLPMVWIDESVSKFFKHHSRDVTVREIDVIRSQEVW
jgi:hypothetical protein